MKAVMRDRYGSPDVMQVKEIERPTVVEGTVLVRIVASSVNAFDWRMLEGKPFLARLSEGLGSPKHSILGADIAGCVEAVGPGVLDFQPGDAVFGDLGMAGCGGFAEYVAAPARSLALIPAGLSFEDAAALPMAGIAALQSLRDVAKVQPGQKVLIHGAAGGVGTFAVQIARLFGAEVTALCSTGKLDLMRSLGADHVLDYTKEDFARRPERYDVILGVNGNRSLGDFRRALAPGGLYVMTGGGNRQLFQALLLGGLTSAFRSTKVKIAETAPTRADLEHLADLALQGKIRPVIDRTYSLEQVPDAVRYVEQGLGRGKVLVRLVG